MAAALAACPTVARPGTTINVAARRSSFYSGSARLTAAPRAANHALVAARARQAVTVEARAAKAAGQITVDVEKPLGLVLDQSRSPKGGLVVKSAGIQAGDTVIYTSSFFGDELWPADKLGFARSAIQAAPSPVSLVLVRGPNDSVDVKKLPKKPAPARFGRRLTAAQKARATHLCVDCGYIYSDELPFEQTATDYRCPQCNAPKRRFARFNVETGKVQTSDTTDLGTIATVIGGLLGVGILGYLGFSL
ncbi:Rubredoxin-1 [Chlorella vulgaris]